MINVLAIGNSFSDDATRYLHLLAKVMGEEINVMSLYIGGCPLSFAYSNILSGKPDYQIIFNGENVGYTTSIKDALLSRAFQGEWDVVTMQQVSHLSGDYETYQPYLDKISDFISTCCPKSKKLIHQTWAYSNELIKEKGKYKNSEEMFRAVEKAYNKASQRIGADIIPCGETIQNILHSGNVAHRDGLHAGRGFQRFALSLTWFGIITGKSFDKLRYSDFPLFDVPVSEDEFELAKKAAQDAINKYRK